MDCLEGLDGFLYIDTEEEFKYIYDFTIDEVFDKIERENKDFNRDEF